MATISSHILDSVFGGSAVGIRCQLFQIIDETSKEKIFDVEANDQGRIVEDIQLATAQADFELVFFSADYFRACKLTDSDYKIVVRFTADSDQHRYHIPVMLSAHSYSVWWSRLDS